MAWSKKQGVSIEGIKPFTGKLKKLPEKIQAKVARQAVNAAAGEVRKTARKLVKQNAQGEGLTPDGSPRDHLYKSIINKTKSYGKDKIPVGTIGTRYKASPHDHLVHEGTAAHDIELTLPSGGQVTVQHPGSRGYPFMEIALEDSRGRAERAMVKKLETAIVKELQKQKDAK